MTTSRASVFLSFLALAALAAVAVPAQARGVTPAAARTINITANDQIKYDVTTIPAKRGEALKVVLKATGTMPKNIMSHNFVLLKKTADVKTFVTKANTARATDYIPADMKADIIAQTKLIGNGETADVTFKAPTVPGTYTFLCTFPGHYAAGMKGTLVVK